MADVTKQIKFIADLAGLQESIRGIGPMLRQLEGQLKINIPIQPSIINPSTGQPFPGSGGAGAATAFQQPSVVDFKQSPAYQFMQMQDAMRSRTTELAGVGKGTTGLLEDRLSRSKMAGEQIETTALSKFVEQSKKLDERFKSLSETIDKLNSQTRTLTDAEMKQAANAKTELADIQKQRTQLLEGSGGVPGGIGGAGGNALTSVIRQALSGTAIIGAIRAGIEIPMSRMASRAAVAGVETRDIEASLSPTSFESMMRMDPRVRGEAETGRIVGGVRGAMSNIGYYAGGGAALGSILPGIGTLAGGVGGAGIGLLMNMLTGNVQRGQAEGYEEAMANLITEQGPRGVRYRAGMGARQQFLGAQVGLGLTDPAMSSLYFQPGQGIKEAMADYMFTGEQMSGMMANMGGMGSGNFFNDPRFGTGGGNNLFKTPAMLARATGLAPAELASAATEMTGLERRGSSVAGQMREFEDMMARAFSRGYSNAPLAKAQLDAMVSMTKTAGGGFGGAGFLGAETIMAGVSDFMGASKASSSAAMTTMNILNQRQSSTGGIQGLANMMGAETARPILERSGITGQAASEIENILFRSSYTDIMSDSMKDFLTSQGMSAQDANELMKTVASSKEGYFAGMMPGGTAEDMESARTGKIKPGSGGQRRQILGTMVTGGGGFIQSFGAQGAINATMSRTNQSGFEGETFIGAAGVAGKAVEMREGLLGLAPTVEESIRQVTMGFTEGTAEVNKLMSQFGENINSTSEGFNRMKEVLDAVNAGLERNARAQGIPVAEDKTNTSSNRSATESGGN